VDSRVRQAVYNGDEVYRLRGHVGYQIDLQFEPGEEFVGLGAGDIEGLSFVAQGNHLFLKPRVANVGTNLTVLTTRRHYHFDYAAAARRPDPAAQDVIYSLRFTYPPTGSDDLNATGSAAASQIDAQFGQAVAQRPRNTNYWYCGHPATRPVTAYDDGVHTYLRFGARSEQPAVFVRNADGSESLLNFSMQAGEVVIHRVADRLIVRRGRLVGCIVNKGAAGVGERLQSGTVADDVQRETRGGRP
jgi:type IV secretion system protein VirB9